MDEPLSALDKNLRQQLQIELRRLHRQLGITIILVTHDMEEAMALGSRVAVMDQGKLVQFDTPREIIGHPATPFVAELIGRSERPFRLLTLELWAQRFLKATPVALAS